LQSHPDPVAFLEQSYSAENPPRPFASNPVLDPNLVRYYVVLHDASSGDEAKADEVLAKVKAKFGNTCCAKLVINTMEGEKEENDGMKVFWHAQAWQQRECVRVGRCVCVCVGGGGQQRGATACTWW
jgi:hypothetical protein